MRIAICDSNIKSSERTKKTIYKYVNLHRLDVLVQEFRSAYDLLSSDRRFNIVVLDYELKGMNGLEAGRILKEKDPGCELIFLSAYTGFIMEAFKVRPYRFLLKPLAEKELFAVLDDFFGENDRPLWVKDGDNVFCFNTADILYVEADNKNCFMGLEKEKIHCRKTMACVSRELPKNSFCKINRAYIVNFKHITGFNSSTVKLKNGKLLHMSRSYKKSFESMYKSFADPMII